MVSLCNIRKLRIKYPHLERHVLHFLSKTCQPLCSSHSAQEALSAPKEDEATELGVKSLYSSWESNWESRQFYPDLCTEYLRSKITILITRIYNLLPIDKRCRHPTLTVLNATSIKTWWLHFMIKTQSQDGEIDAGLYLIYCWEILFNNRATTKAL